MNLSLKDRHALVCGSSQGIGKAAAVELALLGANVTLMARNADRLTQAMQTLDTSQGQTHSILVADFANPVEVESIIQQAIQEGLKADILVNNTGGPPPGTAIDATTDQYLQAFQSHLICNQILTSAIVPSMIENKFGRIVNVISTSVKQPLDGLGVSNTIRGAVASWAKTLANELGQFGITVNNVLPGMTHTGRLEAIIQKRAADSGRTIQEITHELEIEAPVQRIGQPEEIGAAIAFLATPAAAYINGINLPVDGGRTKCL